VSQAQASDSDAEDSHIILHFQHGVQAPHQQPASLQLNAESAQPHAPLQADCVVKKIAADGHCFYRAVAEGSGYGTVAQYRSQVAGYLRQCAHEPHHMVPSMTNWQLFSDESQNIGKTLEQVALGIEAWQYGGDMEMSIIELLNDYSIYVYTRVDGGYQLRRQGLKGMTESIRINLLFLEGQTEAGNHYDLLPNGTSSARSCCFHRRHSQRALRKTTARPKPVGESGHARSCSSFRTLPPRLGGDHALARQVGTRDQCPCINHANRRHWWADNRGIFRTSPDVWSSVVTPQFKRDQPDLTFATS
jgi:hypothetical protein